MTTQGNDLDRLLSWAPPCQSCGTPSLIRLPVKMDAGNEQFWCPPCVRSIE